MHELSLALEVCRIAEASAAPHPARAVRAVAVEVGEDAGIELENFRFCLEALLSDVPFAGARAELTTLPGTDLRVTHLEVDDGRPDD
ncbi:MAG: hydrogenase maturation nickel metallochaperone HypA [Gemmatimonadetes bacterium]|nr:hydrogenase maturation nickel metallochaperone HypA [Gemmatimonadota bacterium]HMV32013.1 hydrogenase maturation nickel metallochaperone HypA [Gemmatimonadales bacterium]MBK6778115.1 hydrogenase maturation nickel metallochaperone HypA [Gemmatimonadota bacterium]MBK7349574.1 hydrogenase maturation nickel metallochaperone HypA [Gemmatimonadota bacterium]MBK7715940.1 hydrogenase maturation nickel metallochaperone HypA [Gemmatimonadota bacterium]